MSNDLVKRLRDQNAGWASNEALEAADRIEELEAKLAKALRVFEEMRNDKVGFRHVSHFRRRAAVVIAELTGGKDE